MTLFLYRFCDIETYWPEFANFSVHLHLMPFLSVEDDSVPSQFHMTYNCEKI